jgi:hypothetical protein
LPLDLSGHAGGDVRLTVRLMGWSSTTNDPDHFAEFSFNGLPAGSIEFDGQDVAEARLAIPAAWVSNGVNTLMVHGVMPPDRSHSFFVVDWVEASFDCALAPEAAAAHFGVGGATSASAGAFAEPLAMVLDGAGSPTWIADETGSLPAKAWALHAGDVGLAVVEAGKVSLLAPRPAAADAWFMAATNQIDYLVVAPRALAAAAQDLVEYREGQGRRAGLVVFEELCDLMTAGVRTPEAIPELLRFASATWERSPQMVVLVGNGHYDYLGVTFDEINHLPPLLIQTPAGVCASDGLLADTSGNGIPDLAIGRLPALSAADLSAMVAKIKAYEMGFGAAWQNDLVLVADNRDLVGNFPAANSRLADLVQPPYSVAERIELGSMSIDAARTNLMGWFRAGAGFINYIGHGGVKNLASEQLLREADIAAMDNPDRPPVVAMLTCLAARYEVPAVHSLGEQLMRRAGGGAVAVLGPSGLSQNAPATELGEAFYRTILHDGVGELGPAFLRARRSLAPSLFTKDTIAVYNLLGDPALRIAGNDPANTAPQSAQVTLSGLEQSFDGSPRAIAVTTVPAGLSVRITYDGRTDIPVGAGSYAVAATVTSADFEGSAAGTLVVAKATATVTLGDLETTYDGLEKTAAATTVPAGLAVGVAYDGLSAAPVAAGSYAVRATVDDANYEGSATGTLVVAKAPATVALGDLAQVYDAMPKFAAAATVPEGLAVDVTYDGQEDPPAAAGSFAVVATVNDANYEGSATGALVVAKAPATVVLGNLSQSYDGTRRHATAMTVPDELAIDFTYNGLARAPTAAGTYAVVGTVSDPNWQGTAFGTLTVGRADQTIDFPALPDRSTIDSVDLAATASSGLPVAFAVVSGPAVIADGFRLSFTGAGPVAVRASQAGNGNWNAAPDVVRTVSVSPVLVNTGRVLVRENGEGRFFIRLARAPEADVAVSISCGAEAGALTVQSGAERIFKPSNWNVWQAVTLAAGNDPNDDDETVPIRISVPGVADRQIEAVVLDDDIGPNLALASRGTTIAGTRASRLAQVIDGVHAANTNYGYVVWTNESAGTMTVDLKTTQAVSRVRLLLWDWVHRVNRYALEGSTDGTAWTLLADASSGEHSGWQDWPLADEPIRYLRFTGLSNSVNQCVLVSELEVHATRPPLPRFEISKTNVLVREGGEGRFFVRLDREPAGTVSIAVARSEGDDGLSVQSGETRTFNALNWQAWQAVTLAAAEDANDIGETATFRISAPGWDDRFVEAVALDDDIGDNLALASGGATAAGWRASRPGQLIDGLHADSGNYGYTIWTNDPPGSITVDLKAVATVSRVRVATWDWLHRTYRYTIESSQDGTNWTMLADASAGDRHGWDEWLAADRAVRFLRFTGLAGSANQLVLISELEVYGVSASPESLELSKREVNVREGGEGRFFVRLGSQPAGSVAVRVDRLSGDAGIVVRSGDVRTFNALNWNIWQAVTLAADEDENDIGETAMFRISAPGHADSYVQATALDDDIGENLALVSAGATIKGTRAFQAARAIDGVHSASTNYGYTIWTNNPPGTLTVDLPAVAAVSRVRLLNWDWLHRTQRYRIETSLDGITWSIVAETGAEDRHGWDDWPVDADQPIRHLRITGLNNSANQCFLVSELEVYGVPVAANGTSLAAKAGASLKREAGTLKPFVLTVVTSDDGPEHTNGWAAVDGDARTVWQGRPGAGGWYIAIGYQDTLWMTNLVVELAEGSTTHVHGLYSLDGEDWTQLPPDSADGPVELNYLWLLFPGEEGELAVPQVIDIWPQQ